MIRYLEPPCNKTLIENANHAILNLYSKQWLIVWKLFLLYNFLGNLHLNQGESIFSKILPHLGDEDFGKMRQWCKAHFPQKLGKINSVESFFEILQEDLNSPNKLRDFLLLIGRLDLAQDLKNVSCQHASDSPSSLERPTGNGLFQKNPHLPW